MAVNDAFEGCASESIKAGCGPLNFVNLTFTTKRYRKMELYLFMKESLLKFNYPNIHGMDDMKTFEIFSNANRPFLVAWIFKQIDDTYAPVVENATADDLAVLLHCNGFCPNTLKKQFMYGECDQQTQFDVLHKMFLHLNEISDKEERTQKPYFSNEDLTSLLNINRNLFPMYGSQKILTVKCRKNKIEKYKKEIESLQNLVQSAPSTERKSLHPSLDNLNDRLSAGIQYLEDVLPDFQRKVLDIVRDKQWKQNEIVHFKESFPETLETCAENAKLILNFIKNVYLVMSLKENNQFIINDWNENTRNGAILRELYRLCNDVILASK